MLALIKDTNGKRFGMYAEFGVPHSYRSFNQFPEKNAFLFSLDR
jgi:hypothetical protein